MFCRCFKVFLFWRKGFLHSESTTCLACTGNRGACSNRGCGWIFNTHSHPAPFSWSSLNAEGWCVRVCVSVCLSLLHFAAQWHLLGIATLGEAKGRRPESAFCSLASAAFQVSEPACVCCCAFSLFPVLTPAALIHVFLVEKYAFLLEIVIIRHSLYTFKEVLHKCFKDARVNFCNHVQT